MEKLLIKVIESKIKHPQPSAKRSFRNYALKNRHSEIQIRACRS